MAWLTCNFKYFLLPISSYPLTLKCLSTHSGSSLVTINATNHLFNKTDVCWLTGFLFAKSIYKYQRRKMSPTEITSFKSFFILQALIASVNTESQGTRPKNQRLSGKDRLFDVALHPIETEVREKTEWLSGNETFQYTFNFLRKHTKIKSKYIFYLLFNFIVFVCF